MSNSKRDNVHPFVYIVPCLAHMHTQHIPESEPTFILCLFLSGSFQAMDDEHFSNGHLFEINW